MAFDFGFYPLAIPTDAPVLVVAQVPARREEGKESDGRDGERKERDGREKSPEKSMFFSFGGEGMRGERRERKKRTRRVPLADEALAGRRRS